MARIRRLAVTGVMTIGIATTGALLAPRSAVAAVQLAPSTPVPSSDAGPLERVSVHTTLDRPAPRRTAHVSPVWPDGVPRTVKFRIHLVLDAQGRVAEARMLPGGGRNTRPISAAEVAAMLDAVRRWEFEPPPDAPMLIATYLGGGDEEGMVMPEASQRPPLRTGGDIGPPRKLHHAIPEYPPEALAARVSGVVILEATIDAAGAVTDARILRSVTGLDEAAVAAVRQWRYAPTLLDGEPVPIIMTVTVNFAVP